VLMSNSFLDEDSKSTDISIWTPTTGAASPQSKTQSPHGHTVNRHIGHDHGKAPPQDSEDSSKNQSKDNDPPVDCDEAHFAHLREKCADLVWGCLQGLISVLDAKDFQAMQSKFESQIRQRIKCIQIPPL